MGPADFSKVDTQPSEGTSHPKALEVFEYKNFRGPSQCWPMWIIHWKKIGEYLMILYWWEQILNLTFKENDTSHKETFPITLLLFLLSCHIFLSVSSILMKIVFLLVHKIMCWIMYWNPIMYQAFDIMMNIPDKVHEKFWWE